MSVKSKGVRVFGVFFSHSQKTACCQARGSTLCGFMRQLGKAGAARAHWLTSRSVCLAGAAEFCDLLSLEHAIRQGCFSHDLVRNQVHPDLARAAV